MEETDGAGVAPKEPAWLTVRELAGEMRVSVMTVYRLVNTGQLPFTRVGKSMRIRRADWDQYLKGATGGGPGTPE